MDSKIFAKPQTDRRAFIGGSDAKIIMGDDEDKLVRLWREKRGDVEPEDLSENLIVQLGTVSEDLNRRWYERNTGRAIKDVQRRVQHTVHRWMSATLDGVVDPGGAVFETKFMLPWVPPKNIWHSSSTICGSRVLEWRCYRSLPGAANGWK